MPAYYIRLRPTDSRNNNDSIDTTLIVATAVTVARDNNDSGHIYICLLLPIQYSQLQPVFLEILLSPAKCIYTAISAMQGRMEFVCSCIRN